MEVGAMGGTGESDLVYVPTGALRTAEWNPRIVFSAEFRQLCEMIRADPWMLAARPVLAMDDGTIYAGAQRYRAVCQLYREGWIPPWKIGHVPAILHDITEAQAKARALRDNNHAGRYQEVELAEVLADIATLAGEGALPTLGFSDDDLRNALAAAGIGEHVDPVTGRTLAPAEGTLRGSEQEIRGADVDTHEETREPLTIVLTFGSIVQLDHAWWYLNGEEAMIGWPLMCSYGADGKLLKRKEGER